MNLTQALKGNLRDSVGKLSEEHPIRKHSALKKSGRKSERKGVIELSLQEVGRGHNSDEVFVMKMKRRASVISVNNS